MIKFNIFFCFVASIICMLLFSSSKPLLLFFFMFSTPIRILYEILCNLHTYIISYYYILFSDHCRDIYLDCYTIIDAFRRFLWFFFIFISVLNIFTSKNVRINYILCIICIVIYIIIDHQVHNIDMDMK